jgi:hypothetical protein
MSELVIAKSNHFSALRDLPIGRDNNFDYGRSRFFPA